MRRYYFSFLFFIFFLLVGCTDNDVIGNETLPADVRELQGIEAVIVGSNLPNAQTPKRAITRFGTVTPLADYVGRSEFKGGDQVVFTEIRRSENPIENFTYLAYKLYGTSSFIDAPTFPGVTFNAGNEGGWARGDDGGPERVYWSDAVSAHTFIAYTVPQVLNAQNVNQYDWKKHQFTETDQVSGESVEKTYFVGSLGDPTQTGENDIIDYYIDPYAKDASNNYLYRNKVNGDSVFTNPTLDNEDLLISYDTKMMAEPGGSVALVKFNHALSSVRVIVNINGFSSSSTAADNKTVVSNMRLLHQPTMYIWKQSEWGAEPCRYYDQATIDAAWGDTGPSYDQRKDIRLWIPHPEGVGTDQSKTFTFYGITTPQPQDYISTLPEADDLRKTQLRFDVTYPDPMNPTKMKTHTYTATLDKVLDL